jgi:MFS family permease
MPGAGVQSLNYSPDRVGRKPVLLYGIIGVFAAMVSFGMGNKYWMLLIARFLGGLSSGNSAWVDLDSNKDQSLTNIPALIVLYTHWWEK